jgi:hypothetical protein
VVLEDL